MWQEVVRREVELCLLRPIAITDGDRPICLHGSTKLRNYFRYVHFGEKSYQLYLIFCIFCYVFFHFNIADLLYKQFSYAA